MYFYIAVALTSLALFGLQLGLRFPGFLRFQAQQLRRRLQGKPWLETPWREFDTHVHIERRDKWGSHVYNPHPSPNPSPSPSPGARQVHRGG